MALILHAGASQRFGQTPCNYTVSAGEHLDIHTGWYEEHKQVSRQFESDFAITGVSHRSSKTLLYFRTLHFRVLDGTAVLISSGQSKNGMRPSLKAGGMDIVSALSGLFPPPLWYHHYLLQQMLELTHSSGFRENLHPEGHFTVNTKA